MTSGTVKHDRPIYDHEQWLEEGKRRFGADPLQWRFVCPACGHVQTMQDFKDLHADPQRGYQECIGRVWNAQGKDGARSGLSGDGPGPCDWAAYGLFGTLNAGTLVVTPQKELWIFDFAEAAA